MHVVALDPEAVEPAATTTVTARTVTAGARPQAGPWRLTGSARDGEAAWLALHDAEHGALVAIGVLLRRDGQPSRADLGYAPALGERAASLLGAALAAVLDHAFADLGLAQLTTRARHDDDDAARALAQAGFVYVGLDRHDRRVWSYAVTATSRG